jgi:hypothetical protein
VRLIQVLQAIPKLLSLGEFKEGSASRAALASCCCVDGEELVSQKDNSYSRIDRYISLRIERVRIECTRSFMGALIPSCGLRHEEDPATLKDKEISRVDL